MNANLFIRFIKRQYIIVLALILFALPFSTSIFLLIKDQNVFIEMTLQEKVGARYHRALFDLNLTVRAYRGYLSYADRRDVGDQKLLSLHDNIFEQIQIIEKMDQEARIIKADQKWAHVRQSLEFAFDAHRYFDKKATLTEQDLAINMLHEFMCDVGHSSSMILDPETEPYFMATVLINHIPQIVKDISNSRDIISAYYDKGHMPHEVEHHLMESSGLIRAFKDYYRYAIRMIAMNDPEKVASKVESEIAVIDNLNRLVNFIDQKEIPKQSYFKEFSSVIDTISKAYHAYSQHMYWHMQERLNQQKERQFQILLSLIISFFLTVLIFLYARRIIAQKQEIEEAKYIHAMLNTVVDGVITIDKDGLIHAFNPSAERIFGYRAEEVSGQNINILMPEPYRSSHDSYLENYLKTDVAKVIGVGREVQAQRRDGTVFPIELSINEFFISGKRMFVGSIRDISERKAAESNFQVYMNELEIARLQADSATRMKSEFLAMMSHEIRTPMNGIIGMTEMLMETPLTPAQSRYLRTIISSAESLLTIINDILDFSKIEARKIHLESIPFDLLTLCEETIDLISVQARERDINVHFNFIPGTPHQLIGDPTRIRQIILNLLSNAVKFTEQGSVTLNIQSDDPVSQSQDQIYITVKVIDTGIGIPKNVQASLFDKFIQADSSTTRKFGGTGLGLAISKSLTEMMGRQIRLESELGKGSTFTFTMCLQINKNASQDEMIRVFKNTSDMPFKAVQFNAPRILLVEDNKTNQEFTIETLERMGCVVTLVVNGLEAVEITSRENFDLVLMDCEMPEMDGFEATQAIRLHEMKSGSKPLTIIALTANAMSGDEQRCLDAGMNDYLAKPVRKKALFEMLSKWLLSTEQTVSESLPVAEENILDIEIFSEAEELMGERFAEWAERYLQDTQGTLTQINALCAEQNLEDIRTAVHNLKSSSAMIGAMHLSSLAEQIETQIRTLTASGGAFADFDSSVLKVLEQAFVLTQTALKAKI